MKSKTTKEIAYIGVMVALIAGLSQIAIPLPSGVPITLQTFAIALCGYFLGWKKGLLATAVYVLLGAVGAPVFANFKAGFAALAGPTGGFIWGFILMTALCGIPFYHNKKIINVMLALLFGMLGLALCHLLGALQFSLVTKISYAKSLLLVSVPYLIKDAISVIVAYWLCLALKKALSRAPSTI